MLNFDALVESLINKTIEVPTYDFMKSSHDNLIELIKNKEYKEYCEQIYDLDLTSLPNHTSRLNLLIHLLNTLTSAPSDSLRDASIIATINAWASPQDKDDPSGVIGDLLSCIACPISTLKIILDVFDDVTPVEMIESQLETNNGLSIGLIFDRIRMLFTTPLNNFDLSYLRSRAVMTGKDDIVDWLDKNLTTVAEIPPWVFVDPGETLDLLDFSKWKQINATVLPTPSKEEIIDSFNDNMMAHEIDSSVIENVTNVVLNSAVYNTFNTSNEYPADPDRMFGPVNRIEGSECVSGIIKGGCRMLTCRCRDFDQAEDENVNLSDPDEWFHGKCDACDRTITDISYALRYPVIGGGFVGEFCSLDCMNLKPSRDATQYGEFVIDNVLQIIENKGIIDRLKLVTRSEVKEEDTDET